MYQIFNENNIDVLARLEDNSIDTLLTDPPYGLSFMNKKWDYDVPSVEFWKECLRVLKPGATALIFAGSRTQHRMAVNVEDAGFILKDVIMWIYGSGFPKAADVSKLIDKSKGEEREVIGIKYKRSKSSSPGLLNKSSTWTHGDAMSTAPSSPEAQLFNGWKSHALKPAYEPILLAMKPNEGTYANNALEWGVSGLWIDGGRIGTDWENEESVRHNHANKTTASDGVTGWGANRMHAEPHPNGRYPANIILDEEAGRMLDKQSGELKSGIAHEPNYKVMNRNIYGNTNTLGRKLGFNDNGGASRFFYCAKASKAERNLGLEELSNIHPTVKPLSLMRYFARISRTPTGGTILDPFMGSATTILAALLEDRNSIGIELDQPYFKIAQMRINHTIKAIKEEAKKPKQLDILQELK